MKLVVGSGLGLGLEWLEVGGWCAMVVESIARMEVRKRKIVNIGVAIIGSIFDCVMCSVFIFREVGSIYYIR